MQAAGRNMFERCLGWLGVILVFFGAVYWVFYKLCLSPEPIGSWKPEVEFPPILMNTIRCMALGSALVLSMSAGLLALAWLESLLMPQADIGGIALGTLAFLLASYALVALAMVWPATQVVGRGR